MLVISQSDFQPDYGVSAALHHRVEFADRSPAAGQCAALVAVKLKELLCDIQLSARAKRVESQADLREWVVSFQLVGFPLGPRQEPHTPYPTQVNLRLRYSSCAIEEKSRSARPRDQFGQPLDLPVQRRIKSGRNRKPVSQGVLCDLRFAGCRLGPRASPCVSPVRISSRGPDQFAPREEVEARTCQPGAISPPHPVATVRDHGELRFSVVPRERSSNRSSQ